MGMWWTDRGHACFTVIILWTDRTVVSIVAVPDPFTASITGPVAFLSRVFHLTVDLKTTPDVLDMFQMRHFILEKRVTFILSNNITDDGSFALLGIYPSNE